MSLLLRLKEGVEGEGEMMTSCWEETFSALLVRNGDDVVIHFWTYECKYTALNNLSIFSLHGHVLC